MTKVRAANHPPLPSLLRIAAESFLCRMTPFRGRETTSVIKKELYQEEAICESIATTESVHTALHWRNDRDAYDISFVHSWTTGMPTTSPSSRAGRQGCPHLNHSHLDDRDA